MRTESPVWLRWAVLGYVTLLIGGPVVLVLYNALASGLQTLIAALTRPEAVHAMWLTFLVTVISVPFSTVFGVLCALVVVRSRNPLRDWLMPLVSMPLALSPVVIGLALLLAYGNRGWFGGPLADLGFKVIFSVPGMVLASLFVTLPFVVREVEPVLREIGVDQEEAAATAGAGTLRTFWYITLPNIRHAVGYGVVLVVARSIGEFGAVSVVSGHLVGRTQTLTQYVADRYMAFDMAGAYISATMLGLMAVLTLLGTNALRRRVSEIGDDVTPPAPALQAQPVPSQPAVERRPVPKPVPLAQPEPDW